MRMCCGKLMGRTVRTTKGDGDIELPARHHEHVRSIIHYLVEGHQRETERHKLNNRSQADHCRADAKPGESVLANRGVNNTFGPKALKQSGAHFVCALIFGEYKVS